MIQEQLKELLKDMSLKEKIDQTLQLVGTMYTDNDEAITGPMAEQGFTKEDKALAGSILSTIGAKELMEIQKKYIENQPHQIPMLFMADIINGYRTVFPIPLAQGASFNPEMSKKCAAVAAKESAASGLHVTFAPMVDLVRDARWGRVLESTGEDTYLNSCFAKAIVEGYQGDDLKEKGNIAACVKHFAAYGAPTAGREYNNVELSDRTLKDHYLPAYEAAVKAGVALVMTSFNTLNHVPCTGNKTLMREQLRGEMGFEGVLISDWAAIKELVSHGVAGNDKEAARLGMEAGVDIDMMTSCYSANLEELIKENVVKEELLDEAVLRILELKNKLGLFENPFKDASIEDEEKLILCENHRTLARESAIESFVLLKNDNNILPLPKEDKTIAFIGPYIDENRINGAWSLFGKAENSISIKEGLSGKELKDTLLFARGCELLSPKETIAGFKTTDRGIDDKEKAKEDLKDALEKAEKADIVVLALGEHYSQSGEGASKTELKIPKIQMKLLRKVYKVNSNIVVVLFNGRPLNLKEISEKAKAVLDVWFPGTEGGNAIADVLFGDTSPSGRLSMSFPYNAGQTPVFYNEFSTGRPTEFIDEEVRFLSKYIDAPNKPLYPFGFGLSYTSFAYSDLRIDRNTLTKDSVITAKITVTNTGIYTGKETVQMYIKDMVGSVVRPLRELKGFEKVTLIQGESRDVLFTITEEMLRFCRDDMHFASEPGEFTLYIGGNSESENAVEFTLV